MSIIFILIRGIVSLLLMAVIFYIIAQEIKKDKKEKEDREKEYYNSTYYLQTHLPIFPYTQ